MTYDRLKEVVRSPATANAVRLYLGLATFAEDRFTPPTDFADVGRCAGMSRASACRAAAELERDGWIVRVSDPWTLPSWRLT
ncbi:MarR family transcriptional regulator [Tsukamurella tyrosinosolvens]|uniref:MarR family transcriptional regulator n=1 Tax=Tsukamurella tyrosinosolvens TaxID=57704 RepID=UPI00398BC3A6